MSVSQDVDRTPRDRIVVVEDDSIPMPVTAASCPKCDNNEAYYWTVQTRRGDEGATEFYRCTKCKHTWRNYGGQLGVSQRWTYYQTDTESQLMVLRF